LEEGRERERKRKRAAGGGERRLDEKKEREFVGYLQVRGGGGKEVIDAVIARRSEVALGSKENRRMRWIACGSKLGGEGGGEYVVIFTSVFFCLLMFCFYDVFLVGHLYIYLLLHENDPTHSRQDNDRVSMHCTIRHKQERQYHSWS
jgi:hypothetical protein